MTITQAKAEEWAFETFAGAHPHEAAEMDWLRFYALVKKANPAVTEKEARRLLKETESMEDDGDGA